MLTCTSERRRISIKNNEINICEVVCDAVREWSEVTRPSADCQTTIFRRFKQLEIFLKKVAEQSRDSGRRSRDCRPTVKQRFFDVSSNWKFFWKKSLNGHETVVGGHATVGRLSNNVFLDVSSDLGNILKKVAERSRDSGRRSRDRRPTVKQHFWTFHAIWEKFWKKSLNGHATVDGGHATVGRLSNNVFWTFQAIRNFFEKSRWTVTWQWSEVTRLSADCQTTFFGRFKRFEKYFEKSRWTVTRQWLRSRDRRPTVKTTFFRRFNRFGKILKKVAERSRDSGRRSRDRRPTVKQRFLDVSSDLEKFRKSRWTVTRQWLRSRDRRPTVKQRFWTFQAIWGNFEKSRWTVTRQWSRSRDRRPTVKQRFWMFQAIRKFCEIGHWTVTRQWSKVTRPWADCQTTFLDVSSNKDTFCKKSPKGHVTVVGGHATFGRLSSTYMRIYNY